MYKVSLKSYGNFYCVKKTTPNEMLNWQVFFWPIIYIFLFENLNFILAGIREMIYVKYFNYDLKLRFG